MSHNRICSIVSTAVLCCVTVVAQQVSDFTSSTSALGDFVTVDVPGAAVTRAMGINADGAVVGDFTDSAGKQHGFLLRGGTFTTLDYPGAAKTQAKGINSQGDIVGARFDDNSGAPSAEHGFLLQNGSFTPLDYPGKLGLIPQRINDDGQIMGCNHDNDLMASMHGFLYSNGAWSQLDTGASMTNAWLPGAGLAVGLYTDMMTNLSHAFVLSGGNMAPFDFPFATVTWGWDMNPSGEIVGQYTDAAKIIHGFMLSLPASDLTLGLTPVAGEPVSYRFVSIDYPGATSTQTVGINSSGNIVGAYVDSAGKQHGFLLVRGRQHRQ